MDALAGSKNGGVTKYTNANTAYANLVPGDVIVFADDSGDLVHVAIYAGEYNLYNTSNSNLGLYHYIIHVGNSRGPEINLVEWMATSSGSKTSEPVVWYHLDIHDAVDATGFIEVNKSSKDGTALSGAYFTATNQSTKEKFIIGPTNSKGYAKSGEMPLGTYTVVETVFPTGYEATGQTSWTVTLNANTPNLTVTVNVVNKLITGSLSLTKTTEDGKNLSGWQFGIYSDQACTKKLAGPIETDNGGKLTVTGLVPGTVWVKELGHKDAAINALYECESTNPQQVMISGNKTATVSFHNRLKRGRLVFRKATTSGIGAEFLLEWSEDNITWQMVTTAETDYVVKGCCTSTGLTNGELVSDKDGMVRFEGMHPELYYRLTETKAPDGLQLLADYAFVGQIPIEKELTVSLRVVNAPVFMLPKTGTNTAAEQRVCGIFGGPQRRLRSACILCYLQMQADNPG